MFLQYILGTGRIADEPLMIRILLALAPLPPPHFLYAAQHFT